MHYPVKLRDRIFIKGSECLYFASNIGKNIAKYISKNVSSKYSQNPPDHGEESAAGPIKS